MSSEAVMPWIKPPYLWEDTDRHGNARRYVVRPQRPKIRIRPDPHSGDPEEVRAFWAAYALALEGKIEGADDRPIEAHRSIVEGTFAWLIEKWKASPEYLDEIGEATRTLRLRLLEACCLEPIKPGSSALFGQIPLEKITPSHIRMLRDRKREVREGANNRLKALRVLFKWMLGQDDVVRRYRLTINPARDVPRFKSKNPDGWHTWTLDEVEQYRAVHGPGTMARRALALFLFTGQRRSDVAKFGPQHLRDRYDEEVGATVRKLVFTQRKNRELKPVTLELPVLPVLQEELDHGPRAHLAFLVTVHGKPFTAAGLGNRMRDWCNQAGLPQCSAHGLRKISACITSENGATDAQMSAIFGWRDPRMAAKYRRMASQMRLASQNMHLIVPRSRKKADPAPLPLLDWSQKNK